MLKYNNKKLEQIFKKHKIVFAYLFGSQANKKTGPLSDIDIAIYFNKKLNKSDRFDEKHKLMADLSDLFQKENIDLVSLNDAYPLLAHRILKNGQSLYCYNIKKQKEYEDKAIGEYLDWEPSLREQTKLLFA
ncbi:nucleotidyltransferase domain-containing protein [Candidatus Kuenenbacteria bacterium]|nr:nucleotidyltransferase domain-containing protein [Candidatus Kuenenbacteria bacterium]